MYRLGIDVNTTDTAQWDQALDSLLEQRPLVNSYVMAVSYTHLPRKKGKKEEGRHPSFFFSISAPAGPEPGPDQTPCRHRSVSYTHLDVYKRH